MVQRLFLLGIVAFSQILSAEVLFEGFAKVVAGGVHVGYFISRYEFNTAKKEFIATSFLKTNELGGNITESIKAYAKEDLTPISYSYTTLIGNTPKTIDAKFNSGKMNASIKDGDKVSKVNRDLPKGAFLSSFLAYVMLKSPKGLTPDTKYEYQAIAEEDAQLQKGIAYIKNLEEINGIKAYKILNEFKGQKFISSVTERGEVLSTKSPVQSISTELMSQSSLATVGFQLPTSLLKQLFGDIPIGTKNEVSKKYQAVGKQQGVPQGKGLMLKGGGEEKAEPKNSTEDEQKN